MTDPSTEFATLCGVIRELDYGKDDGQYPVLGWARMTLDQRREARNKWEEGR